MAAVLDKAGQKEGQQPGQGCGRWARDLNSTPNFTEASKTLRREMNVQGWGACTSGVDKLCVCGEGSKRALEKNPTWERALGGWEDQRRPSRGFVKCLMWEVGGGARVWNAGDLGDWSRCRHGLLPTWCCLPRAFPVAPVVENPPANAGDASDVGLIPESGRCPEGGHGNPF